MDATDYERVQSVIEGAQLIVKDKKLHRAFIREEDKPDQSVVKAAQDRPELYLVSYRRTSADDVRRVRQRGTISKDDLK
jgi:hypothetical protein